MQPDPFDNLTAWARARARREAKPVDDDSVDPEQRRFARMLDESLSDERVQEIMACVAALDEATPSAPSEGRRWPRWLVGSVGMLAVAAALVLMILPNEDPELVAPAAEAPVAPAEELLFTMVVRRGGAGMRSASDELHEPEAITIADPSQEITVMLTSIDRIHDEARHALRVVVRRASDVSELTWTWTNRDHVWTGRGTPGSYGQLEFAVVDAAGVRWRRVVDVVPGPAEGAGR